jgi:hypothetical protein
MAWLGWALMCWGRRRGQDQQCKDQQHAHDLDRCGDRDGEQHHECHAQKSDWHAAGVGYLGVDRGKQ